MAVDGCEEERKGGEERKELHGDGMIQSLADEKLCEDACEVVAAAHMQSEAEKHCFPRDPTHDVRTVKMA
jgi:hypothetical protein